MNLKRINRIKDAENIVATSYRIDEDSKSIILFDEEFHPVRTLLYQDYEDREIILESIRNQYPGITEE